MKPFIKYLSYVLRHKWFVFLECCKMGIVWRGITHDWSKFSRHEFHQYKRHFHGDIRTGRDKTGYYKPEDTGNPEFEIAWLHHANHNDHHWQHWVMPKDDGTFKIYEMSMGAVREMVCDWRGAGRAQGFATVKDWWAKNNERIKLGPATRAYVIALLEERGEA